MKYLQVYSLFLLFVFCTSCGGQNKTDLPKENIKAEIKDSVSPYGPTRMVRNVKQARNGDILIASYTGVWRYRGGQGASFTNITSRIASPSFWDVLEDRKGNLWFATRDSGYYLLPAGQTTFQHITMKQGLASDYGAIHLYEDKTGNIWFGTVRGLYRYDARLPSGQAGLATGQVGLLKFTSKDGLTNDDINIIMEDKTGKLWIGTRGDLYVYDPHLPDGQGNIFTVLKNKEGKTFTNVWGITEDKKGNIWFGATIIEDKRGDTSFVSQGLWRYDGSAYTKISQKGAYAIIEDKNGNIWTTGEVNQQVWALSRYDAKSLNNTNPTVTEIMSGPPAFLGLLEANDGSIWFGSMNGVYRYDARQPDGQGKFITDFKRKEDQH